MVNNLVLFPSQNIHSFFNSFVFYKKNAQYVIWGIRSVNFPKRKSEIPMNDIQLASRYAECITRNEWAYLCTQTGTRDEFTLKIGLIDNYGARRRPKRSLWCWTWQNMPLGGLSTLSTLHSPLATLDWNAYRILLQSRWSIFSKLETTRHSSVIPLPAENFSVS